MEPEARDGKKKQACTVYVFTNVPIPGLKVDEYVSSIGRTLKAQKAVTEKRITLLAQAIVQLQLAGEKLTQVRLAELSGLSVKVLRRLYRAALVMVETMREGRADPRPAGSEKIPPGPRLGLAAPLLESRLGLPPPEAVSA